MIGVALGALGVAGWAYLLAGRGGFWLARDTDDPPAPEPPAWPSVVAVVPARDEADVIGEAIASLLVQDYPGTFAVILIDDESADGTGAAAEMAAEAAGRREQLTVLRAPPLEPGWTGKLWAMRQGVAHAQSPRPDYLLFTDADIAHSPDGLRRLVARAEGCGHALTSLMAELSVQTWPERLLIPAFVFFFQMLYPFRWVRDRRRRLAAAAGGCMLVRSDALAAAGGLAAVSAAIIDDCALAAALKRQGPIWLGLTRRARSIRPYGGVGAIGRMIARSAFAQLDYSALLLAGTLAGLGLVFLAPPLLAIFGHGAAQIAGALAWAAMAFAFQPMLRFYDRSPLWGLALPAIAALYAAFTFSSALDVWAGCGGMWKGRAQAMVRPA
jgi:hopene-associated glycosyltransferase HpnB